MNTLYPSKKTVIARTGWIVFAEGQHILSRFLKPGFRHVYYITKDEHNWLIMDPTSGSLTCTILPYGPEEDVIRLFKSYRDVTAILKIDTIHVPWKTLNYNPLRMVNCVNIIKYICGIKSWAWTPYQLFKSLTKQSKNNKYVHGISSVRIVW